MTYQREGSHVVERMSDGGSFGYALRLRRRCDLRASPQIPSLTSSQDAFCAHRRHRLRAAPAGLGIVDRGIRWSESRYAHRVALDDPRSDEELLAAHIDGDGDAFTVIVERRASLVWSVALKITGNPTDAADAYQESFLAAHRAATSFKGDAAFSTWLYRITVNAALSQRRKKQKITVHQAITDDEYASIPEDRAKPFADQVDVCLDVSEALSGLSEEQQRAVVLVDMFGYSQVEAAEVLQIPEGTVKSRISRARKTLARDLQHLSPGMRSRRAGQGQEDVRDD
ncbi:MAG: sigma-70 family RNA polymerase sigma factor [Candidatus Nanopelagicales bacterium]|nr:sigma-70 family RNA polymerase sigma factor [Candidatus Nanopelagicales bacterium]